MSKGILRKYVHGALYTILTVFIVMNVIAAFHAYKFTHYKNGGIRNERLRFTPLKKLELLFTSVDNPRPIDSILPSHPYKTVILHSNVPVECWYIPALQKAKGTVILFHGYTSNKSKLLERAEPLLQNGYNCLLADFMGSGGSGGNSTTIGYKEAEEVKDCLEYIRNSGERNIYLYGSSMGAVAILKAVKDYSIAPKAVIIECPFATMYETVCVRFRVLHVPTFPMAGMLLFWGSVENGFWGFGHNPVEYAKYIHCPTLLQYGLKDDRVGRKETDDIYNALTCPKKLQLYPHAGHDNYLTLCKDEWCNNVLSFLNNN